MFYVDQVLYKITINLTKLSILTLYLRIFTARWFRLTCWASVVVIFCYATASIIVTIFQCVPVIRFWNRGIPGTCINVRDFWYANAIYNILSDFVILASVPGVVWKLKLPWRQKIALTIVFGLGIFVCVTSVLRMTTLDVSSKTPDTSAGTFPSTLWTTIEASTAVVCACAPMLRMPIQRAWPWLLKARTSLSGRRGGRSGVSGDASGTPRGADGQGCTAEEGTDKKGVINGAASPGNATTSDVGASASQDTKVSGYEPGDCYDALQVTGASLGLEKQFTLGTRSNSHHEQGLQGELDLEMGPPSASVVSHLHSLSVHEVITPSRDDIGAGLPLSSTHSAGRLDLEAILFCCCCCRCCRCCTTSSPTTFPASSPPLRP